MFFEFKIKANRSPNFHLSLPSTKRISTFGVLTTHNTALSYARPLNFVAIFFKSANNQFWNTDSVSFLPMVFRPTMARQCKHNVTSERFKLLGFNEQALIVKSCREFDKCRVGRYSKVALIDWFQQHTRDFRQEEVRKRLDAYNFPLSEYVWCAMLIFRYFKSYALVSITRFDATQNLLINHSRLTSVDTVTVGGSWKSYNPCCMFDGIKYLLLVACLLIRQFSR